LTLVVARCQYLRIERIAASELPADRITATPAINHWTAWLMTKKRTGCTWHPRCSPCWAALTLKYLRVRLMHPV
jgi:hypothetical protein